MNGGRLIHGALLFRILNRHLLFPRSQHTIDSRNSTLQNFKKAPLAKLSCLVPESNRLSASGVPSPRCVRFVVWRRVLPHYVWDALWYGFFFLFARYTGGTRNTNTFLSNKKQKKIQDLHARVFAKKFQIYDNNFSE